MGEAIWWPWTDQMVHGLVVMMDDGWRYFLMFLWMILINTSVVKDWDIPWWNSLNLTDHRCGEFSNRTIEHNYMQELNRLLENVNETEIEIQTCFFSLSSYSGYIGYMWIGVSSYLWIPSISWKGSPTPVSSIADWAAWKLPEVPLLPGLWGHDLVALNFLCIWPLGFSDHARTILYSIGLHLVVFSNLRTFQKSSLWVGETFKWYTCAILEMHLLHMRYVGHMGE